MSRLPLVASFRRSALALAVSSLYLLPAVAASESLPGPIGGEFQVNTATALNQNNPAIAMDADGDFVVVWQHDFSATDQDIRGQRYSANGQPVGAEFVVAGLGGETDETNPSVAMDASGNFVVAWNTNNESGQAGNFGIQARRYNAAGVAQGSVIDVNTVTVGTQSRPDIALNADGDFVVTWTSATGGGDEIRARRFNAAGLAQGGEIDVNTVLVGTQQQAAIDMDANGNFVVTWQSDSSGLFLDDIRARRYNASGEAQGAEFQVNSTTEAFQGSPSIDLDADGDFVIAWESVISSNFEIRARRFNAAGQAQAAEFQVNTTTLGSQARSAVALNARGDFTVVWTSDVGGSDEVLARRYDAAGVAQGEEIKVNTATVNDQDLSAIELDADGDFVVAWTSHATGNSDIRAQRYQGPDSVDISLFQTDSADPAPVGSPLTYTLSAGNLQTPTFLTGIAAIDDAIGSATGLRVVDTLPAGSTAVTASGVNWSCTLPVGKVACNYLLPLLAGEEASPVYVTLTTPNTSGALLSNVARASANQFDDDLLNNREVERTQLVCAESVIELSTSDYSVIENAGFATITATRSGGACGVATVQYDTAGSSATPGLDFTDVTGTLSWADGDLVAKTFTIPILNDSLDETDERIQVSLSGARGASLGTRSAARVTIADDDVAPRVNFTSSALTTGEAVGLVNVSVVLNGISGRDVTVPLVYGGSATANTDYFAGNAALIIPAGQTSATTQIEVVNDSTSEATETVVVGLGTPGGATAGSVNSFTLSITDDDAVATGPTVSFDIASASSTEATANTVTLRLSAASTQTVTVPYTRSGTATFTTDYSLSRSSPVTFNPGQTERTIVITPVDDTALETSETAILTLGTPTNATLGTTTVHTRTILDNDGAP